jgi:hypothetical protein
MIRHDFGTNSVYESFNQTVVELENCLIATNGIVMDSDWNMLPECRPYCAPNVDWVRIVDAKYKAIRENHRIIDLSPDKEYVNFLNVYNVYPYGHIYDNIQPLYKIEKMGLDLSKLTILRTRTSKHCRELDLHLKYFGYTNTEIIGFNNSIIDQEKDWDKEFKVYRVPKFWYSTIEANSSGWCSELLPWIRSKYNVPDNHPKRTRLYLSRGGPDSKRGIQNNDEVINFLMGKGFHVLKGDESLIEMVRMFHDAEIIIYPHGAMAKNTIFCAKKPYILEFCSSMRKNSCFVGNSKAAGYHHDQIFLDPVPGQYHSLEIDINFLNEKIKEYENLILR